MSDTLMPEQKRLMPDNPTFEDCQVYTSPEAMRERLYEHSLHNPTIRYALHHAEAMGLSCEDAMTLLAFHMTVRAEKAESLARDILCAQPKPVFLRVEG